MARCITAITRRPRRNVMGIISELRAGAKLIMDKNWFVIHAKRFRETVGASVVAALGLEVFVPMVKVESLEHVAIKFGFKPLFPSYFFARFNPEISLGLIECAW